VLRDVTTWSLTHFEAVRSWSLAEELTSIEISETHQLISRHRRMTAADYPGDRPVLATPTAIEPAGDTLWYGERAADRAHSMPLPK
jgi:hypothetical protein